MQKLICVFILAAGFSASAEELLTRDNCEKILKAQPVAINGNAFSPENIEKKRVNEQLTEIQGRCRQQHR